MPDFASMTPEQLKAYYDMAFPLFSGFFMAILIMFAGWIASKWANRAVLRAGERSKLDEALKRFLASIAQYTVIAAAVIAALGKVGIETTSLVAVFASAGLAVGLALQGSLSSFASGVMILFFRPFVIGDRVTAGGETGKVKDIGLFATTLMTAENHTIILPNSSVIGGVIKNFTREGTLRASIGAGVAYGADLEAVQEALLAACKKCDLVLEEPAPAVAFVDMAASSLNFSVMPWCNAADLLAVNHQVRSNIYNELNARGIEIPFDQIVVHQAPAE
ncbi:MAG: mechanosensitive ion channel [Deltaproteobacteria bacterium]|nr:MAG: mechanosensitive ion channel [Deltaproteobacteria bacterium]